MNKGCWKWDTALKLLWESQLGLRRWTLVTVVIIPLFPISWYNRLSWWKAESFFGPIQVLPWQGTWGRKQGDSSSHAQKTRSFLYGPMQRPLLVSNTWSAPVSSKPFMANLCTVRVTMGLEIEFTGQVHKPQGESGSLWSCTLSWWWGGCRLLFPIQGSDVFIKTRVTIF